MRNKRRMLLIGLLVLAVGWIAMLLLRSKGPPEPVYAGKELSEWLMQYCRYDGRRLLSPDILEEKQRAANAITNMGTNAIPHLLRMLCESDSAFKKTVLALAEKQRYSRPDLVPAAYRNYMAAKG